MILSNVTTANFKQGRHCISRWVAKVLKFRSCVDWAYATAAFKCVVAIVIAARTCREGNCRQLGRCLRI
eukprot:scaffold661574_cov60-Prasinocladus_malaysianus.AAC.1